jgi:hypothetical protein
MLFNFNLLTTENVKLREIRLSNTVKTEKDLTSKFLGTFLGSQNGLSKSLLT